MGEEVARNRRNNKGERLTTAVENNNGDSWERERERVIL